MKKSLQLLSLLILTGCAAPQSSYEQYLQRKGVTTVSPAEFQHCHGYGCKYVADITFSEKDWKDIKKTFRPQAKTAERERAAIKKAIALFEQKAGVQAGTSGDHWGTFRKTGSYQHDCVDESTNTTVYLSLLEQKGFLKFHKLEAPTARLPLIHGGRWPHQTAVISQINNAQFFVVDSWFHDNGLPPEIVPLTQWKEGWKPDRSDDKVIKNGA